MHSKWRRRASEGGRSSRLDRQGRNIERKTGGGRSMISARRIDVVDGVLLRGRTIETLWGRGRGRCGVFLVLLLKLLLLLP